MSDKIAKKIVYRPDPNTPTTRLIESSILEAVKAEREACAKIADNYGISINSVDMLNRWQRRSANSIAKRIRERGA